MDKQVFPVTKKEAEKRGIAYSSEENRNALFPTRLRNLREKKGVSQATLASVLKVSKSTVGLWETGDTLPDAKSLHDMAEYFQVSADYMLCLSEDSKRIATATEDLRLSEQAINSILALNHDEHFSPQQQAVLNALLSYSDLQLLLVRAAEINSVSNYLRDNRNRFQFDDEGEMIKYFEDYKQSHDAVKQKVGKEAYIISGIDALDFSQFRARECFSDFLWELAQAPRLPDDWEEP